MTTETEDGAPSAPTVNVNNADVLLRGDLVQHIAGIVEGRTRPTIIGVRDTLSGALANVALKPDGSFERVPATIFDDYLESPRSRRGTAKMTSLDSFIAISNRFKDEESAVFANDDRSNPSLTTVFDYNPANKPSGDGILVAFPRFGRHRASFAFPLSDEWKAWTGTNGTKMGVADFAAFLEDRIGDVAGPGEMQLSTESQVYIDRIGGRDRIATPTELVMLSRGLHINENATVTDFHNLSSGEVDMTFKSEHTDATTVEGATIRIPTSFQIAIPVFRNGPLYGVVARLRYRPRPLQFYYELYRIDRVFDHAFTEAADRVGEETGLPVYLGAPEV